jgi:histidinol-phosphate aminotransferase
MKEPVNQFLIGLHPYAPGEQPTEPGWVKINTNENPYPPAPEVKEALCAIDPELLRKYPPPDATAFREAVGRTFGWPADGVMITNGSDEGLRMLCHAYLNPGDRIGMLWPTYSLYPTLGRMFGADSVYSPVGRRGEWPEEIDLDGVKLFFLANPNPPFGTFYEPRRIEALVASRPDVLFAVDEAYVMFAPASCMALLREHGNLFVLRTFSKSHGLAGLRIGLLFGPLDRMEPLRIVRDSYNVNAASQLAGIAAWKANRYYEECARKVVATRRSTVARLAALGFDVLPSDANFIFARHPKAKAIYEGLKARRILVRYFDSPETRDGLRITIGTPEEMETMISAVEEMNSEQPNQSKK